MKKMNLKNHASAQCHVVIGDNTITFVSYTTEVIRIVGKGINRMVECTGTYSPTTRKQIGWFLKEYADDLTYYDMKKIVGMGLVNC